MKTITRFFLSAMVVYISLNGYAQTENQQNSESINFRKLETVVPGKLIYKNGDVVDKEIKYSNPEELKKLDGMIYTYEPDQIAFGSVSKDNLEAFEIDGHFWTRIIHKEDEQFGIMHIDGAIQHYSVFRIPFARVEGDYQEQVYIRKLNEEPIVEGVFVMKYRKKILLLVSDNEELVTKINNKEKGYKNFFTFEKVVREYNEWHAANYIE